MSLQGLKNALLGVVLLALTSCASCPPCSENAKALLECEADLRSCINIADDCAAELLKRSRR